MPTNHLFLNSDLEPLEQTPLTGHFQMLVVGTFNADIPGNTATWFYGRKANQFWWLFPSMLGHASLHPKDNLQTDGSPEESWKKFCTDNQVVIVDLFKTVLADVPNHNDEHLQVLKPDDYIAFDFEKAFSNCTFDYVCFTWKRIEKNTLTDLKNKYKQFFESKGSKIMHLFTPSLANRTSKEKKLLLWKEEYNK